MITTKEFDMLPASSVALGGAMSRIQRVTTTMICSALCCALALPVFATGKYQQEPIIKRETVYVTDHKHDGAAYALVGAGIAWWLTHRYHKRHPKTVERVIEREVPAECPSVDVRVERAIEACGK